MENVCRNNQILKSPSCYFSLLPRLVFSPSFPPFCPSGVQADGEWWLWPAHHTLALPLLLLRALLALPCSSLGSSTIHSCFAVGACPWLFSVFGAVLIPHSRQKLQHWSILAAVAASGARCHQQLCPCPCAIFPGEMSDFLPCSGSPQPAPRRFPKRCRI